MLICKDCGSPTVVVEGEATLKVVAAIREFGPRVAELRKEHNLREYAPLVGQVRIVGDLDVQGKLDESIKKCSMCGSTNLDLVDDCPHCGSTKYEMVWCNFYHQIICKRCRNVATCRFDCRNEDCPFYRVGSRGE